MHTQSSRFKFASSVDLTIDDRSLFDALQRSHCFAFEPSHVSLVLISRARPACGYRKGAVRELLVVGAAYEVVGTIRIPAIGPPWTAIHVHLTGCTALNVVVLVSLIEVCEGEAAAQRSAV